MNNISLGNYPVYDPPPGSPFCNFFEETAGCSRYGYGIFCMLAKDYKALLDAHATVVRLIMTAPHGTSTDAQFKMERDVVLGRARFLSSDVGDVKNSTFTHTFVNVVVYDLTFFLNTNDTQHVFVNVVNTTSTDMSTDATVYYPSTLNGGTAQHDWSDIWSTFTLTTPASGFPSYKPRNLVFDGVPQSRIFDRLAAINFWIVGRKSNRPDAYVNINTLRQQLRFYAPGEADSANTTLLAEAAPYLLESTPTFTSTTGAHLPSYVSCFFPAYNSAADDPYVVSNRSYEKTIATGGANPAILPLHISEYLAYYDENTAAYANTAELDAVAAELAPKFFNALAREANGGVVAVYAGIFDFTIDGIILSIRWESNERGARTIISRDKIRRFSPLDELYGSLDSLQNQSLTYIGHGNTGLSVSGARFVWGYGGTNVEEQSVITQIRLNGLNFEYKTRTAKCAWAGPEDASWTVWVEGTTCATSPASAADILNWMGM